MVSPRASMSTKSRMRRALVSGRLAVVNRYRMAYRFWRFNAANTSAAAGSAARAAERSSGTSMSAWPEYADSHRPSALARSTSVMPAGCIRHSALLRFHKVSLSARTCSRGKVAPDPRDGAVPPHPQGVNRGSHADRGSSAAGRGGLVLSRVAAAGTRRGGWTFRNWARGCPTKSKLRHRAGAILPLLGGRDAHLLPPPRLPLAVVQQRRRLGRPVGAGIGPQRPAPAPDQLFVLGRPGALPHTGPGHSAGPLLWSPCRPLRPAHAQ